MTDGPFHRPPQRLPRRQAAPADVFPTFDDIARRAYEIYVADGKRLDRVFECWECAETELLDRAARRAIR